MMRDDQVEVVLLNAKFQTLEGSPAKIASIQQMIMAINALSKVFMCYVVLLLNLIFCSIFPPLSFSFCGDCSHTSVCFALLIGLICGTGRLNVLLNFRALVSVL